MKKQRLCRWMIPLFSFEKDCDKKRFMRGRPWAVQGFIMSIQEWSKFMVAEEVSFDKIPFWVHFHNIPLDVLEEEENIQNMGNLVGDLV